MMCMTSRCAATSPRPSTAPPPSATSLAMMISRRSYGSLHVVSFLPSRSATQTASALTKGSRAPTAMHRDQARSSSRRTTLFVYDIPGDVWAYSSFRISVWTISSRMSKRLPRSALQTRGLRVTSAFHVAHHVAVPMRRTNDDANVNTPHAVCFIPFTEMGPHTEISLTVT